MRRKRHLPAPRRGTYEDPWRTVLQCRSRLPFSARFAMKVRSVPRHVRGSGSLARHLRHVAVVLYNADRRLLLG